MNTIILEGNKYQLIQGTQSDGRCFSASVYYDLNKEIPNDQQLNTWIQQFIIEPILATEETDCPQFFQWAIIWASIHNNDIINNPNFVTNINEQVDLSEQIQKLSDLLTQLKRLQQTIQEFNGTNISDVRNLITTLLQDITYYIEDTFWKQIIQDNPQIINLFVQIDEKLRDYVFNTLEQLKPEQKIPDDFIDFITDIKNQIQEITIIMCNNSKNNQDYKLLIDKYKDYINLLNTPFNNNGNISYEWTEPDAGPIDILFKSFQDSIKSINIYSTLDKRFIQYFNTNPEAQINGIDLYLYYENGNHYKPLIFIGGEAESPEETKPISDNKLADSSVKTNKPKPISSTKSVSSYSPITNKSEPLVITSKPPSIKASGIPIATPVTPTAPPVTPTAPPVTPTAPPVTSTASPVTPTAPPATPTTASVTPTAPPVTATAPPVTAIPIPDKKSTTTISQNDSDTKKKDEKIPNSVIIYIKTRIPNFYKLNYEPYMTVPKSKSHTVYFDPLVKYYEGPIKNIPSGAPKDAIFTQFFQAAEFDSMINRILSDFRYMQKPRTFEQAYDERIIDNNMRLTLKNLFKPNSLFYINKKPYTIVGVKSNPSDWQIDKKPLEKLLNQFSHLTAKQVQDEATKEEDDIPEVLRQSNVASSNISNNETLSSIASGLKKASEKQSIQNIEKEMAGITDSFVNQDKLPGVSKDILNLYTKYLRQNIPINYSDVQDLSRDPLTLSLLIEPSNLLAFINSNKKTDLIDLYSTFSTSKSNLQEADKNYIDACTELAKYKTTFDKDFDNIRKYIRNNRKVLKISEINNLIQQITELKINYMTIIFSIADAINEIYELQKVYFISTRALLVSIKQNYANIIKYYETPELALKCIENDIDTFSSLIEEDPEDPYSNSYYTNYNNFKQFYDNLYKNKQQILQPQINYSDEAEIYIKTPSILSIEKEQYEIYNFKMFLFYSYNQFDIWVLLFKSIEFFTMFVGRETNSIINLCESSTQNLNDNFTLEEQNNYLQQMNIGGVKATINKSTNKLIWHLVKEDGTRVINPIKKTPDKTFEDLSMEKIKTNKTFKQLFKEYNKSDEELFEILYLQYIKTSVKAYDAIILYIYLLEILCLRQNRVYVAEENVNQLNLEFSITLQEYYDLILYNIGNLNPGTELYIPASILWDVNKIKTKDSIEQRKTINSKSNIIFKGRLKAISESRENLVTSCEEISKIITPNISKSGFIDKCNSIIIQNFSTVTPHSFKSSYWIDQTIRNYDIQTSKDFIYNMNKVVKDAWYDRIIDDISAKFYLDWMVFDNNQIDIDSLYASVADGLNRQLDITENETNNPYTIEIDGRRVFTTKTIQTLVFDVNEGKENPIDLTKIENNIIILETTLKIKFIIFEMYLRNNKEISIGDMVLYKNRPHRVISINNIGSSEQTYNLYNGYTEIKDVKNKKIKKYTKNLLDYFRINCNYDYNTENVVYNDFMYLVLTKNINEETGNQFYKYKLVQQIDSPFIFTNTEIPIYVKYLIFNSCPLVINDRTVVRKMGLEGIEGDLFNFETKRRENIERENIQNDIENINNKIKKYKKQYKILNKKADKSLEEQAEQLLLKEEVKDLEQRIKMLEEFKQQIPSVGGARTIRPSEQYGIIPQYNYNTFNSNMPGNVVYLPSQRLPYQNMYYTNQYRIPYNVSQNKAKDQKSKLSFYITIELELFPGTSANLFQKSVVKCQSTFERIREAWADIFGFQYRPAVMSEAYAYNVTKDTKPNQTKKKRTTENNRTRKNKS